MSSSASALQPRPPSGSAAVVEKVSKRMTLRTLAKRALREEREREKREKIKAELDAMRKVRGCVRRRWRANAAQSGRREERKELWREGGER